MESDLHPSRPSSSEGIPSYVQQVGEATESSSSSSSSSESQAAEGSENKVESDAIPLDIAATAEHLIATYKTELAKNELEIEELEAACYKIIQGEISTQLDTDRGSHKIDIGGNKAKIAELEAACDTAREKIAQLERDLQNWRDRNA